MKRQVTDRIRILDSLRGLAAVEVLIHHTMVIFPIFWAADFFTTIPYIGVNLFTNTPLHILWAGHEAVMLFFVLSGFVLAVPYTGPSAPSYDRYLIRRFFRIYVPYLVVVLSSLFLLKMGFCSRKVPVLSNAINSMWDQPVSAKMLLDVFFMLGDMHRLVPSAWSLVHEMRISIFFPFLAALVMKLEWRMNLLFGFFLAFLGSAMSKFEFLTQWSLGETFFYASLFVNGALLAKHRQNIGEQFRAFGEIRSLIIFAVAWIFYTFRWLIAETAYSSLKSGFLADYVIGLGAALFIILVLSWEKKLEWMQTPPFLWLGKVSYGLYLIHPMVLLISIYYLWPIFSFFGSALIGFFLSIILAGFFYKLVDHPAINLGHLLSQKRTPFPKTT